jgi:hypothetical protein
LSIYPRVDGTINVAISDSKGGWYIGGTFITIAGLTRNNIAHISSDGSVDLSWVSNANGLVSSLLLNGSMVYVGGIYYYWRSNV